MHLNLFIYINVNRICIFFLKRIICLPKIYPDFSYSKMDKDYEEKAFFDYFYLFTHFKFNLWLMIINSFTINSLAVIKKIQVLKSQFTD